MSYNTISAKMGRQKMTPNLTQNSTRKINSLFTKSLYRNVFNAKNTRTQRTEDCFGRSHMNSRKKNNPSFSFGAKWNRYFKFRFSDLSQL